MSEENTSNSIKTPENSKILKIYPKIFISHTYRWLCMVSAYNVTRLPLKLILTSKTSDKKYANFQ